MPLTATQLESDNPDAVASTLGQMYPRVRLDAPRGQVRFRADIVGDERLSFARFSMGFHAQVIVEPEGMFTSALLLGGELQTEHGDGRNVGGVVFGQEETVAEYRGSELLVVTMPESVLLGHFARMHGVDTGTVRLLGHQPLPTRGRSWAQTAGRVFRDVIRVPSAVENDLTRTAAFDHVLAAATLSLPFQFVGGTAPPQGAGMATIRRAIAYMESHLGDAITVDDIAAASRVTARGLQAAFRRHRDSTPMAYLRRARLSAAHRELLASDERTVREVALKWGFSNTGRFNRLRRETFGL